MDQYSHYKGLRRRRKRERGPKKIFEGIIVENLPNMGKEIVNQVQETQRDSDRINPRRNTQKHKNQTNKKLKTKIKYCCCCFSVARLSPAV